MILRRGVSALVPAGAPYFARQAPLVPTIISTIAGREYEGGKYGVTANPQFAPLGTNAVPRGSRMATRRGVRGLGATVTYCQDRPPDAATAAIIAARGDTMSLVPCGGVATPLGQTGNVPLTPTTVTPVAPVYTPIDTGVQNCALQDTACVVAAAAKQTANQAAFYQAQANYNAAVCVANGGEGYVPPSMGITDWCGQKYGGNPNQAVFVNGTLQNPSGTPAAPPSALPAGSSAAVQGGSLSFHNLTSGNSSTLQVGDNWQISISGATPNTQVSVTGGQGGQSATTVMGSTDSNGNFSLSGQISSSQVGAWQESWSVGSAASGFIAFTVAAPAGSAPLSSTPSGGGAATPLTSGGAGAEVATTTAGTFDIGSFLTSSMFLGIPNWILLAGVAGAIVLFGGKK